MSTVHVKNISSKTSEKEVRDFFSFCGKISSLSVTPESDDADASKCASVTFEKDTAAKTALLLDSTQLGPAQVSVSAASSIDSVAGKSGGDDDELEPEDKPKARILAEYLAHGYVISDKAIQQALDVDKKQGISARFQAALANFDAKYNATDKVKQADSKLGVSTKAGSAWAGLTSYFEKALDTPNGQRVRKFYMEGTKQVLDVHNEARHLANLKTGKTSSSPTEAASAEKTGTCTGTQQVPGTDSSSEKTQALT